MKEENQAVCEMSIDERLKQVRSRSGSPQDENYPRIRAVLRGGFEVK